MLYLFGSWSKSRKDESHRVFTTIVSKSRLGDGINIQLYRSFTTTFPKISRGIFLSHDTLFLFFVEKNHSQLAAWLRMCDFRRVSKAHLSHTFFILPSFIHLFHVMSANQVARNLACARCSLLELCPPFVFFLYLRVSH